MTGRDEPRFASTTWKIGAGVAVGFAAVATGLLLSRGGRRLVKEVWQGRTRTRLEDRVLDRLWADRTLARRRIDVGEIGEGIVELTGWVRHEEEADRAVALAQAVPGVNTVLNRIDTQTLESKLERTRQRYREGDPALTESHWYGMEVGTGRRRQSPDTDPARRDDAVDMVSRELEPRRAERNASEPLPGTGPAGVEGNGAVGGEAQDVEGAGVAEGAEVREEDRA